jgi:urease accessory protein
MPGICSSLAWQIGNRHLAAEITETAIRLRSDHVIRDMLIGLGATVEDIEAPFDPEGGAYGGTHASHHHHDHDHDHSHDHAHGHEHGHTHD